MASVRNRSGSWQARWYLPNGKLRSETRRGWTKGDALRYAQQVEAAARRTPWVTAGPARMPHVIEYGRDVLASRIIGEQRLKADLSAWSRRVAPHFEGLRVTEVNPDDIRAVVGALTPEYAPSTVRDTYGLIRYVFETALSDGLISASPCVRVSLPRRNTEDEVAPAPPDSVRAIAAHIDPRYQLLVHFLAATGCRIGEALAIETADLSFVPIGRVQVSKTMHDDGSTGPTKSRRSRTLVLPEWIVPAMRTAAFGQEGWLFPAPEGGSLPPRRFASRFWRPAAEEAGYPTVTPHRLRHLHATQLLELGRPITEVAMRLGHANSKTTMEVYAKWIQPDDSGAAAVVPDYSRPLRLAADG